MKTRDSRTLRLCMVLFFPATLSAGACATTQPITEQAGDAVITARVGRRLSADPEVERVAIDVDTLGGVVYLRGKVDTSAMKYSAAAIARSTDGVKQVVNDLIVDPNTESDLADGDVGIKTRVGAALSGDDDVRRVNVDVDVIDGVVTLSGIVHNEAEAREVERITRETRGVLGVRSQLQVEQKSRADPEKLGKIDDDGDREES